MRIAAIGDVHCRVNTPDLLKHILPNINEQADALVVTGDLTDTGLPEEAEVLGRQLRGLQMPVIAVLGNHDHESEKEDLILEILKGYGVNMLENGNVLEIEDVGFVGTKGFAGGFGKNMIQPFGEKALKKFVRVGIKESVDLEVAITKMECKHKFVVLHYAPIKDTLIGEPPEIFAFLGSERLGIVLDRQKVDIAVHGHAHHGSPEGRTPGGIPVYNVSRYVQDMHFHRTYMVFNIGGDGNHSNGKEEGEMIRMGHGSSE